MDITYAGEASFVLKGERVVVINPAERNGQADITLFTRRRADRKLIVNGPGEYEIAGVLIATVPVGTGLAHAVELDGINVLHLERGASLNDRDLAAIGKVDVLLIESEDLKQAQAAITDVTPRVVIPFGKHASEVCAAAGVKDAEPQARFSWNGITTPPRAVLLKASTGKRRPTKAA